MHLGDQDKFRHLDHLLNWEIIKTCRKYKAGDTFFQLCMEEKLSSISYNNPKELLDRISEILNICKHRKIVCLVGKYFLLNDFNQ